MTDTRRPTTTTRNWKIAVVVLVLLALAAGAANPITRAISGRSIGALMAERDGIQRWDRYDRTALVPAGVLPDWFPTDATAIVVGQPGPKGGLEGSLRIDAVLPTTPHLPADCLPSDSLGVPFPLPGDWPHYTKKDLHICGAWTVFTRTGHLYLWRENV